MILPRGAFGGESKPPTETPDTLASEDFAVVEILLGEAPMSGIPIKSGTGMTANGSIYLNGIPIQAPDGKYNYPTVTWGYKLADENPALLSDQSLHNPSDVKSVNLRVKNGSVGGPDGNEQMYDSANAVVWQLTNLDANGCAVTLKFPRLEYIDKDGDIVSTTVYYYIQFKPNGGDWLWLDSKDFTGNLLINQPISFQTTGKSAGGFKQTFYCKSLIPENQPYQVRVLRWSSDSDTDRLLNELWVDSYQEVISLTPKYPGSAILQVKYDARTFESPPTIGVDLLGMQCHYPHGYNPGNATYGFWDGSFDYGFTNNPAWIFRELCLNKRWGLGDYLKSTNLDDAALYALSQYCDELVPGPHGPERRFECNAVFAERNEAFTFLQNVTSIFHGMLHYSNSVLAAIPDSPGEVEHLFTPSNVVDGYFKYEGTSNKARRTVVHVSWNDENSEYKQTIETVQDDDLIARYGYIVDDIVAVGCTHQGQAVRLGRHILESEKLTQAVTFTTSLEASFVLPGQVIAVADPLRIGIRVGGRIIAASTTQITVDAEVSGIPLNNHMALYTVAPNGSINSSFTAIESDSQTVFVFKDALDSDKVPIVGAQWVLTEAQKFRVMGVKDSDKPNHFEITAAQYSDGKYAAIDRQVDNNFDEEFTFLNPKKQNAVEDLRVSEALYIDKGLIKNQVTVTWDAAPGAHRYIFSYSRNGGPFGRREEIELPVYEFQDLLPGEYVFRVIAVNAFRVQSTPVTLSKTILGKTAPPPDITELSVVTQTDGTRVITWVLAEPVDFAGVRIRYSTVLDQPWNKMLPLHTGLIQASPWEFNSLASGTYLFAIKALDTSGNESTNDTRKVVTLGLGRTANIIGSYDAASDAWSTDLTHIRDGLALTGILTAEPPPQQGWDDLPSTWNGWTSWDDSTTNEVSWDGLSPTWDSLPGTWDGLVPEGGGLPEGARERWIDLPSAWEDWGAWTSLYDHTVTINSKTIDLGARANGFIYADHEGIYDSATVEWSQSPDGVDFTPWSENFAEKVSERYVRARLTVARTNKVPVVRRFLVTVHGNSKFRSISSLDTASLSGGNRLGTGDIRLPVGGTFATIDGLSISFIGVSYQGFRYVIVDYSAILGPRVKIFDSGGVAADATISALITGT